MTDRQLIVTGNLDAAAIFGGKFDRHATIDVAAIFPRKFDGYFEILTLMAGYLWPAINNLGGSGGQFNF